MKLTAQKTIQNPNSQMMSLFDENDICLGEIHKREHSWHIVKCVNSHDALVTALNIISDAHLMTKITVDGLREIAKQALKVAGEAV